MVEKYAFIGSEKTKYSVCKGCLQLGASRSGFCERELRGRDCWASLAGHAGRAD